nr:TPA: NADH dehydrogenase subunit 6 [Cirrodrilus suzukii]
MLLLMASMLLASFMSIMMANTPMMLGINILMSALSIAYFIYVILSPWYSFLLFLIYLGGMLIIFAYMMSLTPNIFMSLGSHFITLLMMLLMNFLYFIIFLNLNPINNKNLIYQSTSLYAPYNLLNFILITSILLLILVLVSKMILISKGPMRPFYKYE